MYLYLNSLSWAPTLIAGSFGASELKKGLSFDCRLKPHPFRPLVTLIMLIALYLISPYSSLPPTPILFLISIFSYLYPNAPAFSWFVLCPPDAPLLMCRPRDVRGIFFFQRGKVIFPDFFPSVKIPILVDPKQI